MLKFTLYGAYKYDPTLFDGFNLPDGLDKDFLINELMDFCGEMYPRHQVPYKLKESITNWFNRNEPFFKKQIDALMIEYNPIENYDRYEDSNDSGSDKLTKTAGQKATTSKTGSDSNVNSGSDSSTLKKSAFDSDTFSNDTESVTTLGSGSTMSYDSSVETVGSGSDTDLTEYGKKFTSHVHGNIGVTQASDMIRSTVQLYGYDIYTNIRERFEKQFILQVY